MTTAAATSRAFTRITIPAPDVDPLAWLARQSSAGERIYWCARDHSLEVAGVGAALRLSAAADHGGASALEAMHAQLAVGDPAARFYGGLRFDHAREGDASWASFGAYWFVLPAVELVREHGVAVFAANVPAGASPEAARAQLERMAGEARTPAGWNGATGEPAQRADLPDRSGWERNLQSALRAMEGGEIEKIVLARRTVLGFARALDPLALLHRLRGTTRDCFHFAFQPAPGATFIGASPERFYRRQARQLETEAVAGTRARGETPEADRLLGAALLASDKDRREHVVVREMIRQVLGTCCDDVRIDAQPRLIQLARGQHLFSGVSGTLRAGVGDAALMAALHPTPAVGGTPTPSALARIRAWEPFDRGWYAGPVGWLGRDAAEFAVAIRTALCRDTELALFSGAGIVPGSNADDEWDEVEHKIQDFVRILDATGGASV